MGTEFAIVQVFERVALAQLAQSKLQSLGIEAFIDDVHMISVNWLYSNALGGVKLRVRAEDAVAARRALEADDSDSAMGEETWAEKPDEPKSLGCPGCGSEAIHFQIFSERLALLSLIVLNFPLPWLKRKWVCKDCQHQWTI